MRLVGIMVGLAVMAALVPVSPETVERVYSLGLYPPMQQAITSATNTVPVALLDVLLVVAVVLVPTGLVMAVRHARRDRRWRPLLEFLAMLTGVAAGIYLLFLVLWGMNYRRIPMDARITLDRPAPTAEAVLSLGQLAVRQMNALYGPAREEGWRADEWRDDALRPAFAEVQLALSNADPATPGRLKQTVLGPYFRWTGVDGMINPLGLEVVANPDLLPFERPFVAAHEWAHLAGYADESEANFVGWLTCIRASPASQYSGWLYLYWQVSGELDEKARAGLAGQMTRGPQRDVDAIVDRLRRGQLPLLRSASWLMYDQYLKANRVDEGVRNYGLVVNLILRARFDGEWMPMRRVP